MAIGIKYRPIIPMVFNFLKSFQLENNQISKHLNIKYNIHVYQNAVHVYEFDMYINNIRRFKEYPRDRLTR